MSYLAEVLLAAEKPNAEVSKTDIPGMSARILECKHETNGYIDDIYQQFVQWPVRNKKLIDSGTRLFSQSKDLQRQIEEVTMQEIEDKKIEFDNLSVELERSRIASEIITQLIACHKMLGNVRELQEEGQLLEAAREFVTLEEFVNNVPEDEVTDALRALTVRMQSQKSTLAEQVLNRFNEHVQFVQQTKSESIQINSIKIRKDSKDLSDVLLMLNLFGNLTEELDKFSKFLLENLCKPVLRNVTMIKSTEDDFNVLVVSIKKSAAKVSYKEVFRKLIEIFQFVHAHFDYSVNGIETVAHIGNTMKSDLSEAIVNDNMKELVPTNPENTDAFQEVITDMKSFQRNLVQLKILEADSNPILDYIKDMDTIFVNNKCQEYFNSVMSLMKKDLHDMVSVGKSQNGGNTVAEFPESSVSRSTLEILDSVEKLIQQALNEPELFAAHIVNTTQNIFYQYGNVVYSHHERLLQTIPQQVALFRNNCMYIAHQLVHLNKTYRDKFPKTVLTTSQVFMDQGHQLTTMGNEIFSNYVENQVKQMESTLGDGEFTSLKVADKLKPDTDKCLRQCIRQYELLKTVWSKVLPLSVYNKTLGYLFNTFCKRLIETVVRAQDIPSANAEQLVEMYKVVLTRGPKLFGDPQEISLHVELWQKLNDLVFILAASLVDIDNRWADGKGPLTLTFKAEEVRELIKALFQNTDRRAAVLSRIR